MGYVPDPELVGLLGELHEQPERTLLSIQSYGRRLDEPLSSRKVGLSSVEREILQAHREEAAHLLNTLAYEFSFHERPAYMGISHWNSATECGAPQDGPTFDMRCSRIIAASIDLPTGARLALEGGFTGRPSIERAARLSSEIIDSGYSRLWMANAALIHERLDDALRLAGQAIERTVDDVQHESARFALGFALLLSGRPADAWELVFSECQGDGLKPSTLLVGLLCALETGRNRAVDQARQVLDELLPATHPTVESFCASIREPGTAHHTLGLRINAPTLPPTATSKASSRVLETLRK